MEYGGKQSVPGVNGNRSMRRLIKSSRGVFLGFLDPNPSADLGGLKEGMVLKFGKIAVFFAAVAVSAALCTANAYAADYKVVKGDSLYKIGNLFGVSTSTLMADNNLKSTTIYPGQKLWVNAKVYTVKSGDTLYLIAKRYGITVDSIMKANNKWDTLLMPGQKLILPRVAPDAATASTMVAGTAVSRSSAARPVIRYTNSEFDLLSRLVTAEAANQPYDAQVGVAAVVINRVQSGKWADSISSVIYQVSGGYYQFTPIENGYINNPATEEAKMATYDALFGSDPTNGAEFYFDDSATNKWLWSRKLAAYIGNMVFVY